MVLVDRYGGRQVLVESLDWDHAGEALWQFAVRCDSSGREARFRLGFAYVDDVGWVPQLGTTRSPGGTATEVPSGAIMPTDAPVTAPSYPSC
ncbi:hypothetical protein [Nakamurella endophytica]|uniref:Uncharacterized protein n=1 Tax=Nakamurella endophytica TaxID=1748367 RepID=A0A917STR1_9ACTN|nr:hypothetical protein [Nakamurella endophytica]GGL94565.1 hypothetical protein GCM10011594_12940 [Nakamurella endophytica]